jgi:hypothetical protein
VFTVGDGVVSRNRFFLENLGDRQVARRLLMYLAIAKGCDLLIYVLAPSIAARGNFPVGPLAPLFKSHSSKKLDSLTEKFAPSGILLAGLPGFLSTGAHIAGFKRSSTKHSDRLLQTLGR